MRWAALAVFASVLLCALAQTTVCAPQAAALPPSHAVGVVLPALPVCLVLSSPSGAPPFVVTAFDYATATASTVVPFTVVSAAFVSPNGTQAVLLAQGQLFATTVLTAQQLLPLSPSTNPVTTVVASPAPVFSPNSLWVVFADATGLLYAASMGGSSTFRVSSTAVTGTPQTDASSSAVVFVQQPSTLTVALFASGGNAQTVISQQSSTTFAVSPVSPLDVAYVSLAGNVLVGSVTVATGASTALLMWNNAGSRVIGVLNNGVLFAGLPRVANSNYDLSDSAVNAASVTLQPGVNSTLCVFFDESGALWSVNVLVGRSSLVLLTKSVIGISISTSLEASPDLPFLALVNPNPLGSAAVESLYLVPWRGPWSEAVFVGSNASSAVFTGTQVTYLYSQSSQLVYDTETRQTMPASSNAQRVSQLFVQPNGVNSAFTTTERGALFFSCIIPPVIVGPNQHLNQTVVFGNLIVTGGNTSSVRANVTVGGTAVISNAVLDVPVCAEATNEPVVEAANVIGTFSAVNVYNCRECIEAESPAATQVGYGTVTLTTTIGVTSGCDPNFSWVVAGSILGVVGFAVVAVVVGLVLWNRWQGKLAAERLRKKQMKMNRLLE